MKKIFLTIIVCIAAAFVFVACSEPGESEHGNNTAASDYSQISASDSADILQSASDSQSTQPETKKFTLTLGETEMEVTLGQPIGELPAAPEQTGYTATGWAIGETAITAETVWTYTENKTATATYAANTYTLTVGETELTVTYDQAIGELPVAPEQTGYTATGWAIGETAITAETVWTYTENKTATATYVGNTYTLTCGETELPVTYDQAIGELPVAPEQTGYTGVWMIGETAITAETLWTYTENKTATSTYAANTYTLTCGETELPVTYDQAIGELPAAPEQTGYTATGWAIGETAITAETVWTYTENKTATATYTANTYTLTCGETELPVTYGEAIGELPVAPEQTGYTGVWMIGETAITAETVWNYAENKTAQATYSANDDTAYTIKFYANSPEDEETFTEQTAKQLDLTGTTDTTAEYTGNVSTMFRGYSLDEGRSTTSGTIAGDGSLVLEVYCAVNLVEVNTWATFWSAVEASATAEGANSYIVLTADIDPKTELGKTEYKNHVMSDFYGVIDGKGHVIKNITIYQDTAANAQQMSVFDTFTGELKNIGFVNMQYSQQNYGNCNGFIARSFTGFADNIYLNGNVGKNVPNGYGSEIAGNYRFGAMFGNLQSDSTVKNCIINLTEANANVYDYGYVAGNVFGSVTVENIATTDNAHGQMFGNFRGATVNGTSCTDNETALTLIDHFTSDEDDLLFNASSVLDGGADAIAYVMILTHKNIMRVTTAAELYTAANDNSSAYIVLANDIDCQDYTWAMINNTFTGTLNGGGHSIKNVTLTGGTTGGHTRMAMFKTFNGKLKNVAFDNAKINVKGCLIAGLIASTFGGTATNVKVDVEFLTLDAYADKDTNHRAGAMFGETGSTATVSNCFIKVVTPGTNKIGYIAGRLSENITMDNIVVVTNANAALFLMTVNKAAKVNGTVITTNDKPNDTSDGVGTNAISAMAGHYLLIDTEANVIANAGSYLGSAWVCDGEQLPYLKTIDEE